MKYQQKSFTVPAVEKPPEKCEHGWLDVRSRCVFCGVTVWEFDVIPWVRASDRLLNGKGNGA